MKWAFIDYENINRLDKLNLSAYKKIIIFMGHNQNKINFRETRYNENINLTIIQVNGVSKNNLDFYLSYYLGFFNEKAPKETIFHVISNDKGFNFLVDHINKTIRPCRQIEIINKIKKKNKIKKEPRIEKISKYTNKIIEKLSLLDFKLKPNKKESLYNYISTSLNIKKSPETIETVFNELIVFNLIYLEGNKVKYIE